MKCINVEENFDALLDGEVSFLQKREIEKHLENCVSCQTEYENLQAIGGILKQNLAISAPSFLDEKVFSEFKNFHPEKSPKEKIGWFGIPRFAFTTAMILFVLATISAFQIGRMSASEISIVMPEVQENKTSNREKQTSIKIVEVPVFREKIVEVPVIREKIVTKTIYVNRNKEKETQPNVSAKNNFTLKSSVENNGYLTQTNLKDFQPVSEFKIKISKEEKENEK